MGIVRYSSSIKHAFTTLSVAEDDYKSDRLSAICSGCIINTGDDCSVKNLCDRR